MKKSTVKWIGWFLAIVASVIVISGAVKTGIDNYKNKDKDNTENSTAQVQVVDGLAA